MIDNLKQVKIYNNFILGYILGYVYKCQNMHFLPMNNLSINEGCQCNIKVYFSKGIVRLGLW